MVLQFVKNIMHHLSRLHAIFMHKLNKYFSYFTFSKHVNKPLNPLVLFLCLECQHSADTLQSIHHQLLLLKSSDHKMKNFLVFVETHNIFRIAVSDHDAKYENCLLFNILRVELKDIQQFLQHKREIKHSLNLILVASSYIQQHPNDLSSDHLHDQHVRAII